MIRGPIAGQLEVLHRLRDPDLPAGVLAHPGKQLVVVGYEPDACRAKHPRGDEIRKTTRVGGRLANADDAQWGGAFRETPKLFRVGEESQSVSDRADGAVNDLHDGTPTVAASSAAVRQLD